MVLIKAGLPTDVTEKQRKLAWLIYAILIGLFIAISSYQIWTAVTQRSNPPSRVRSAEYLTFSLPQIILCAEYFDASISQATIECLWGNRMIELNDEIECSYQTFQNHDGRQCIVLNIDQKYNSTTEWSLFASFSFNRTMDPDQILSWSMTLTDPDDKLVALPPTNIGFGYNLINFYPTQFTYLSDATTWDYGTTAVQIETTMDPYPENSFLAIQFQRPSMHGTVVEQLDPFSVTATVGAIGGFWSYVCLVFGIIFAYRYPAHAIPIWERLRMSGNGNGITAAMATAATPCTCTCKCNQHKQFAGITDDEKRAKGPLPLQTSPPSASASTVASAPAEEHIAIHVQQ